VTASEESSYPADGSSPNPPLLDDLETSFPRRGVAVVALKGEHDLSTDADLRSLMQTLVAGHPIVLVDVTEAQFIDSTVLHTLVLADRQARAADHRFVLVAGTEPIVSTALRVSGVVDYLECASSVEEALASPSAFSISV
jgi:anti-anti-sigma factor